MVDVKSVTKEVVDLPDGSKQLRVCLFDPYRRPDRRTDRQTDMLVV